MIWLIILSIFTVYSFISLGIVYILAINMDNIDRHVSAECFPPASAGGPKVSMIIPCRNEREDIGKCIESALAQSYRDKEIIVVDGNSEDGTWDAICKYAGRIKALRESERPKGWTGKNWGAYLGYRASDGEILLFVDGDMVLEPDMVTKCVCTMKQEKIDLLSLGPKMVMNGFWEKLMLPLFAQFIMLLYMPPLMNRDRGKWAMANGQFLMARREAYEKSGTHERIRGKIVEDVNLAKMFRASGFRVRFYWASQYLSTRMYRNFAELWEGIVRDIQGEVGRRFHLYLLNALYIVATFYLPVVLALYFAFAGEALLASISAISLIFIVLRMFVFQVGTGSPKWFSLLFPVSMGMYLAMVLAAFSKALRGADVVWKKRHYPITMEE
ncbi:MAG: glycosyltransferase [Thermoplasmata archaeon]|jgi:chlorobactene glucosyltransferase|nr:glycosyltransferase [Candidatus Sysuiplasma jiujiangense]